MKKIVAVILALVMVLGMMTTAFAADTAITVGEAKATAGKTVEIPVAITGNEGFASVMMNVEYDETVLTLNEIKLGLASNCLANAANGSIAGASASDITGDGNLFTLVFTVSEDAAAGEYAVELSIKEFFNAADDEIAVALTNGKITVIEVLKGDANGDGQITARDATRILQYLVATEEEQATFNIDLDAADFNGDGEVTSRDATAILQYLVAGDDEGVYVEHEDWDPTVKKAINDFVETYKNTENAYVVFDFDNTTSIFDVEEQLAVYQLQVMAFEFAPEELPAILATELGDLTVDRSDLGYGNGSYQDWIDDITAAYTYLYTTYGPFTAAGLDAEAQATIQADDMWAEFATKMRAMYDLVYDAESASVAYPWVLYWFTGMTEQEVYDLAAASHSYYGAVESEYVTWETAGEGTKVGPVSYEWTSGTGVSENLKELYRVLDENGIDVWVCSASAIDPIRAAIDVYGLHDYVTGVIAMARTMDEDGRYVNSYDYETGYGWLIEDGEWVKDNVALGAQTQGVGKVEAINAVIFPRYGVGPLAGFMDSTGDYNFCTEYANLKLVINFNRASRKVTDGGGVIAELAIYQRDTLGYNLEKANAAGDTFYVLQGREENGLRGLRPYDTTMRLGKTSALLFRDDNNYAQLQYMIDNEMTTEEIVNTFAMKTSAEDSVLGFKYGFLSTYAGYHNIETLEDTIEDEDVVILYTNDVHTYIDSTLGYSEIAALKDELGAILVDAGDHIQGTAYGSMDKGKTIVDLMNAAGYDLATLGNHEFDYGMDGRINVTDNWAEYDYVSCNFYNEENGVVGDPVLDAYKVIEMNGVKVAFVGITTPESFTKSTPAYFQDENGNYIYGIAGGTDGAELYAAVQAAIDAASAEADYVIALGHLGDDASSRPWTSEEVIANTTGLDAFIDGHSHSTVEGKLVADKEGNEVLLTQTGEYFNAIGKMTISDGVISTELVTEVTVTPDAEVAAIEEAWLTAVDTELGVVIGEVGNDLSIYDENGTRLIRKQETNAGDFAADALYYLFDNMGLDVDVAIMNGGGIRATINAGEISYKTCKTMHTFGNVACLQTITGQQLLDALEWGAKNTPASENGGFLQVSGVTYEVHSYIPSTVQADEKGVWVGGPTGEYRVQNVMVGGEPLDLEAEYNLAGYNYTLRDLGDGFAMFGGAVNVLDYVMEDYMVLANYVSSFEDTDANGLPNVTGYEELYGEGRITIVTEEVKEVVHVEHEDWDPTVKKAINDFVDTYAFTENAYVVFDFDNTTSIFDVEEQLAVYQLQVMAFEFAPEDMPAILATELGDLNEDRTDLGYGNGSYQDWIDDITAAYTYLYENYGPFTAAGLDAEAQATIQADDMWAEFATKMRAMYDLVYDAESPAVAYPWVLYWFTGMTEQEVYDLAAASHSYYGAVETSLVTWETAGEGTKVGPVSYEWTSGTGVSENLQELYRVLDENGIDVWVCSASAIDPIRAAVDVYGLHDYVTGVIAMARTLDENGCYVNSYDYETGYGWLIEDGEWVKDNVALGAQTQGVGKVEAINAVIFPRYGVGPLAGFMDSTGDYNFCTEYANLKLVINFNRASRKVTDGGGVIAELAVYQRDYLGYDLATANAAGDTYYVLQGRDEYGLRGLRPSDKTMRYGKDAELLFRDDNNYAQLQYMIDNEMNTEEIVNTFAMKTSAEDSVLGFKYGFLSTYAGYHNIG